MPRKGCFGLIDYEKAYCPDLKNGPDIFDLRGIDRERGAMVVVRPDQYVSNVLPLDAHDELAAFFGGSCSIVTRHGDGAVGDGRSDPASRLMGGIAR